MQAGPHCVPRGGWRGREGRGHLHVYQSVCDSEFCVCACCMGGWSVCRGCVCVCKHVCRLVGCPCSQDRMSLPLGLLWPESWADSYLTPRAWEPAGCLLGGSSGVRGHPAELVAVLLC